MIKLLVVAFACAVLPAHAQQWVTVAVATGGAKLVVDAESVTIEKYASGSGKSGLLTSAVMRYIDAGVPDPFLSLIDAEECIVDGKGSLVVVLPDNTSKTYQWSASNRLMTDAQGQFLCGYTKEKQRQLEKRKISI